jgi:hypothetical protein
MITTITTTQAEDSRIAAAFGHILNAKAADGVTPRNATAPEVKAAMVAWLTLAVKEDEQSQARIAAQNGVSPIAPTAT